MFGSAVPSTSWRGRMVNHGGMKSSGAVVGTCTEAKRDGNSETQISQLATYANRKAPDGTPRFASGALLFAYKRSSKEEIKILTHA